MSSRSDQPDGNSWPEEGVRPETVTDLVREHYQAVYRFAYRLSGSAADAEDLVQHAFLTACRKLDQVREEDRVRAWLFTIVRNQFLKSVQRGTVELSPLEDEFVWEAESEDWSPEFDEERLQTALDAMPETFRTAVLLHYFEDLSYRKIAELLEVPIGTVMSRLSRGKRFLRERLALEPATKADHP